MTLVEVLQVFGQCKRYVHRPPRSVLIAGRGPGAWSSAAPPRAGIRVSVFEKRPALSRASRASTFHTADSGIPGRLGVASAIGAGRCEESATWRKISSGPFEMSDCAGDRLSLRCIFEQANTHADDPESLEGLPNRRGSIQCEVIAAEKALVRLLADIRMTAGPSR